MYYIEHMAIDEDKMFGTTRRTEYDSQNQMKSLYIWILHLKLNDETTYGSFIANTFKSFKVNGSNLDDDSFVTGIKKQLDTDGGLYMHFIIFDNNND